jgi:hypothetical protein
MKCPVCKSRYGAADLAAEYVKDELIDLASYFGKLWVLVNEYADCFRKSQWSTILEKKRLRKLQELKQLFESLTFDHNGKRYKTDRQSIISALRAVCDYEKYGFENHNYLKQVLIKPFDGTQGVKKAQRVSAEGFTAKDENEIEQQRIDKNRVSVFDENEDLQNRKKELISGAEFMKRNNLESLVDGIGQNIKKGR